MNAKRTKAVDTVLPVVGAVLCLQVFGAIAGVLTWFAVERNSTNTPTKRPVNDEQTIDLREPSETGRSTNDLGSQLEANYR